MCDLGVRILSETLYGSQHSLTKICIDGYINKVLSGRIYHYLSEYQDGVCFASTMEFLNCMEFILKETHFQDYQECRTFQQSREVKMIQPSPELEKRGKRANFVVKILFRQHTSWQGTVLWCEKKKENNFRSALELLQLIDSAIEE